jgi:hypothetical protein
MQRSREEETFVSTGQLPTPEIVTRLLEDAHREFRSNAGGRFSHDD